MKKYIVVTAVLILSVFAPTAYQEYSATQTIAVAGSTVMASDRIIEEDDAIIGTVLGGLVGGFLDADRDDRIHASDARYHRACNQGDAYFSKARQTSDLDERIAFMQEGIRHCPDNPAAHNDLGLGLMIWGDLTAARTHFAQALRIDPDYSPARINLSRITYPGATDQKTKQQAAQASHAGGGKPAAGLPAHRGSWERHFQNSKEALERRNRWSQRQEKLIKQNGGYD